MNYVWNIDIETLLEIIDLAKSHGKRTGDSMQEEFLEVLEKKKEKFKLLGQTEYDVDLLAGNLREEGKKVLNLNEIKER